MITVGLLLWYVLIVDRSSLPRKGANSANGLDSVLGFDIIAVVVTYYGVGYHQSSVPLEDSSTVMKAGCSHCAFCLTIDHC